MALLLIIVLILLFVLKYVALSHYKLFKFYKKIESAIFYNAFIRYILQNSLKVEFAVCTTLAAVKWAT